MEPATVERVRLGLYVGTITGTDIGSRSRFKVTTGVISFSFLFS